MGQIIVTGHDGFIGTHLIPELEKKYKVIGISNSKKKPTNFQQIKKDIRKIQVKDVPTNISCVIHLAALTNVDYCQKNPLDCFNVNVNGTQNILEIARKLNSKFIFLSTSHVFGNPKKLPIDENHPKNPTSIYSASKIAGESLCESYAKSYGMDISIVRLFSVYGPWSSPHLVTNKIINNTIKKKKIPLGNLTPKRDFIFVTDVIQAILLILQKSHRFESFNVGTGKATSISQLCKLVEKISKTNVDIRIKKSLKRKNDIEKILANSKKLRKLGWKPKTTLFAGLKETYNWAVNNFH